MRIPIMNMDSPGIIQDVLPHDLPVNAWSGGKNVSFHNGRAEKIKGFQLSFTPADNCSYLQPFRKNGADLWLYTSNFQAYVFSNGTGTNISRSVGGLYGAVGQQWTGGVLNGVPIVNNPTDVPQMWPNPDPTSRLEDLSAWPTTWRTRSIRPFGNFLVALATKKGSDVNNYRVNWSHVADPGTVPISWDIADQTLDAGEVVLADTQGELIDQATLGRHNIIYKADRTYSMQHVGGLDIFAFPPILGKGSGLLVPNGVQEFNHGGAKHLVLGPHDIYVHDGQTAQGILQGRLREWFYKTLNPVYYKNAFVAHNHNLNEIYICFPSKNAEMCDLALVWNYRTNSTTIKDLPHISYMAAGIVTHINEAETPTSWNNMVGTWAEQSQAWGFGQQSVTNERMLSLVHHNFPKAYVHDYTSAFGDGNIDSYVERIGLNILGQDTKGNPIFDSDVVKVVTEIWPRVRASAGTRIDCYVGVQMQMEDPITWHGPYPYIVGSSQKVTPYCSGKIISVRFRNVSKVHWDIAGYDLDIVSGGKY